MISVICASFLGEYPGSCKERDVKFIRAVNSFLKQQFKESELVIVSDGCEITNKIYYNLYRDQPQVRLITIAKQPLFCGLVRQAGLQVANGNLICYLDGDDMLGENHLTNIAKNFGDSTAHWCYFDDYIRFFDRDIAPPKRREVNTLTYGSVGTSNIAHRNKPEFNWLQCDGYGHDWTFIQKLMKNPNYIKIEDANYLVCHIPNSFES